MSVTDSPWYESIAPGASLANQCLTSRGLAPSTTLSAGSGKTVRAPLLYPFISSCSTSHLVICKEDRPPGFLKHAKQAWLPRSCGLFSKSSARDPHCNPPSGTAPGPAIFGETGGGSLSCQRRRRRTDQLVVCADNFPMGEWPGGLVASCLGRLISRRHGIPGGHEDGGD